VKTNRRKKRGLPPDIQAYPAEFDSTPFLARRTCRLPGDYAEGPRARISGILNRVPIITESFVQLPEIDNQLGPGRFRRWIFLKDRMFAKADRTLNIPQPANVQYPAGRAGRECPGNMHTISINMIPPIDGIPQGR